MTSHDSAGRPVRMSLRGGPSVVASYDSAGRLGGLDLPNGVRGRFKYTDGRVSRISYSRGGRLIASQSASYDRRGRCRPWRGISVSQSFRRRRVGRPSMPRTKSPSLQLGLDGVGTRGNLLQDETHRYQWDARGPTHRGQWSGGWHEVRVRRAGPSDRPRRPTAGRSATCTTATTSSSGSGLTAPARRTSAVRTQHRWPAPPAVGSRRCCRTCSATSGPRWAADGRREALLLRPVRPRPGTLLATDRDLRGLDVRTDSGVLAMGARTYEPRRRGGSCRGTTWGIAGWGRRPVPVRPRCADRLHRSERTCRGVRRDGVGLGDVGARTRRWLGRLRRPRGQGRCRADQPGRMDLRADRVSHDLWAGFDVVANVCGTSAVGSSAAALPLLGAGRVGSRVLGTLADDAVAGAAATRVGSGFGGVTPGVSVRARLMLERLLRNHEFGTGQPAAGIDKARFAQRSFSERFSAAGAFGGQTIDDVAAALRSGALSTDQVPINVVVRDGAMLIANTRSAQALTRAGIPRAAWKVSDRTGDALFEGLVSGQLRRNHLDGSGIDLP